MQDAPAPVRQTPRRGLDHSPSAGTEGKRPMWNRRKEHAQNDVDAPGTHPSEGDPEDAPVAVILGSLPDKYGRHFVWMEDAAVLAMSPELAASAVKAVQERAEASGATS